MAFKQVKQIEEDRYGKFLRLDDEKSITGIILYDSYDDVLVADCHYVNSKEYTGYVHCCEEGCPACAKGIRVQRKLFVPILVLADLNEDYDEDTVIFWDRNMAFNHQLRKDVFDKYPCPSDTIFKITRHGAYRDKNTRYSIIPKFNFPDDVHAILDSMNVKFPDYYENVVRSVDAATLSDMLMESSRTSESAYTPSANYSYKAVPRKKFTDPEDLDDDSDELPGVPVAADSSESDLPTFEPAAELESYSAISDSSDSDSDSDDEFEPTF